MTEEEPKGLEPDIVAKTLRWGDILDEEANLRLKQEGKLPVHSLGNQAKFNNDTRYGPRAVIPFSLSPYKSEVRDVAEHLAGYLTRQGEPHEVFEPPRALDITFFVQPLTPKGKSPAVTSPNYIVQRWGETAEISRFHSSGHPAGTLEAYVNSLKG